MKSIVLKARSVVSKMRNLYFPAAVGAFSVMLATANSYAITWPPTAADLGSAFDALVATIGGIFAAVVTAGLVLYGGVLSVQAGIGYFGKFLRKTTAAA